MLVGLTVVPIHCRPWERVCLFVAFKIYLFIF